LTGVQEAANNKWQRMWCCGRAHVQSGRHTTDTSVTSWSHHLWSFQSHPTRGKQGAYSVVGVFLGSVATQTKVRWESQACTQKLGVYQNIVCQKLCRSVQEFAWSFQSRPMRGKAQDALKLQKKTQRIFF